MKLHSCEARAVENKKGSAASEISRDLRCDRFRFPPAGICIYCGSTDQLSDEHIVPFSLGGNWVLPKASCGRCSRITQKIEQICTSERYGMFYSLRVALQLQSRSSSTTKTSRRALIVNDDDTTLVRDFPAAGFPLLVPLLMLPTATLLDGGDRGDSVNAQIKMVLLNEPNITDQPKAVNVVGIYPVPFIQMIAKIGFAYVAARVGVADLLKDIPQMIRGEVVQWTRYVGGFPNESAANPEFLHHLAMKEVVIGDNAISVALVHLFARFGFPRYHVVVGQRRLNNSPVVQESLGC